MQHSWLGNIALDSKWLDREKNAMFKICGKKYMEEDT